MSEIKVNSIKGVGASDAAITVNNSDGTCTLASGSKLNNCTTDGTTNLTIADGNLVVGTAGHGIDFSANSNLAGMTSELLDTYEEGTWTPTFSSSGATFVYNHQSGSYQKVGNTVHVQFYITLSGTNSSGLSGNAITINLPFTATGYSRYEAAVTFGMVYNINLAGFGNPLGKVFQGNSHINLVYAESDSGGGAYSSDRFDMSGAGISGSVTYRI